MKLTAAELAGRVKVKPNGKVSVKTHLEFTGPDGPPHIPATFFKSKYPRTEKKDHLSDKAREFVKNRKKYRPPAGKPAPGTIEGLKAKVKERQLASFRKMQSAYNGLNSLNSEQLAVPHTAKAAFDGVGTIGSTHPASFATSIFRQHLAKPPINLSNHPDKLVEIRQTEKNTFNRTFQAKT